MFSRKAPGYTVTHNCKKCGDCCRVDGYVFLGRGEEKRIMEYLAVCKKEFRKRFTDRFFLFGRVLKLDAEGCCFLVESRCVIYEVRPMQCRSFPYWPGVMRSKKTWNT